MNLITHRFRYGVLAAVFLCWELTDLPHPITSIKGDAFFVVMKIKMVGSFQPKVHKMMGSSKTDGICAKLKYQLERTDALKTI